MSNTKIDYDHSVCYRRGRPDVLHTLILLQTFANVGAADAIKVCDFGFTKGQRRFLKARGQLLVANPPIPKSERPSLVSQTALVEYIARDVDTVVGLDCDVMLTGDPRSEVAELVSEMRQSGEIVAACNENFDLGTFCQTGRQKERIRSPSSGFFTN